MATRHAPARPSTPDGTVSKEQYEQICEWSSKHEYTVTMARGLVHALNEMLNEAGGTSPAMGAAVAIATSLQELLGEG